MSNDKVTHISENSNSSKKIDAKSMLERDAREYIDGSYTKAIILYLDDGDGKYNTNFSNSGMSMSEALALLEVSKVNILQQMGYVG